MSYLYVCYWPWLELLLLEVVYSTAVYTIGRLFILKVLAMELLT